MPLIQLFVTIFFRAFATYRNHIKFMRRCDVLDFDKLKNAVWYGLLVIFRYPKWFLKIRFGYKMCKMWRYKCTATHAWNTYVYGIEAIPLLFFVFLDFVRCNSTISRKSQILFKPVFDNIFWRLQLCIIFIFCTFFCLLHSCFWHFLNDFLIELL